MFLEENLYKLNEKFNVLVNVGNADKERFKSIFNWCGSMMELSVKERLVRESITPLRSEIWTADFGENVGSETNRIRPCLIIQEDHSNLKAPTVIVVPMTNHEPRFFSHIRVEDQDLESVDDPNNAPKGALMVEQVRNLSKARLGRRIAKFTDEAMRKVDRALVMSLGIGEKSTSR